MSISTPSAQSGQTAPADESIDLVGDVETHLRLAKEQPEKRPLSGPVALRLKHAVDRVIALTALLVLAPVLVAIAVAVRLSGPGPLLFVHERIGINGKPFRMWKFRSMRVGADDQLADLLRTHGRNNEPFFKVPDDPRVTRLGHWLRRWSLDELPQLWNVALGQMSLVGPRPQVHAEVALYTSREHGRLAVRPGLTGLWQISGRSALPWQHAIELDLRYVKEWSLRLDLWILFKTLGAVVNGHGAL
ncbi:sugar transferase [Actinoallomurus purpureus]|uniref:sugar transferase n=1 Tax=Actinoallomurus purpureus TaxID=478114 RepID=UPI002092C022|nr:sugar transferase [Actinoallomurus purpureus]MCO6008536.1 sugar transferase [Actinoallomurus purpureus]